MAEKKEYLFKQAQHNEGISQKTNRPYDIRKITFADPVLIDVHKLNYHPSLDRDVQLFKNGDRVFIETELIAPTYGNGDSYTIVVGITPAK